MSTPQHVIFTTMKNEGPFMLEWVAHNLSLGFDALIIYTNDCSDGTDMIARRLGELGVASHVPNPVKPGGNPQHQMLRRARRHPMVQGAEWLMCLDADEFINITVGDRTIPALIGACDAPDAISMAWRLFGCGGVEGYADAPVTGQFILADHPTDYASGRAYGLKTLFRNNGSFGRFGPHRPKDTPEDRLASVRWSDGGGRLFPADQVGWRAWPGFDHSFGRIHHYCVRSIESFMVKRDRGRTNHINVDQAESYWRDMNINRVEDRSIAPLAERARLTLTDLMDDPVLARLHREACDWHRARIAELKARADWAPFRKWLHDNKLSVHATGSKSEQAHQ
ncbi:MAG: glycosyltransferase family 2 protein [Roseovarius sp.]|nr:glycosyltransferase family 2 protein [Roseovarius sp.]